MNNNTKPSKSIKRQPDVIASAKPDYSIEASIKHNIKKGVVARVYQEVGEDFICVALSSTEDQAVLIKRLLGQMTPAEQKAKGFNDSEIRELSSIWDSI